MRLLVAMYVFMTFCQSGVFAAPEEAFEFPKKQEDKPKYFDDYGHINTHFDAQTPAKAFENPSTLVLSNLFKSYSLTMRDLGITTWLAHGTLLSWYWNHKVFPWEADIDMHVDLLELQFLASYYNMTVYQFHFPDSPYGKTNEYLLDINPNYPKRAVGRQDNNRIDARWVDMANGAYIDITAVHPLDPHARENGRPMLWQTKDGHLYDDAQLYPLRCTVFEGVETYVPNEAEALSAKEYTEDALKNDVFNGYRFSTTEWQWIALEQQDLR